MQRLEELRADAQNGPEGGCVWLLIVLAFLGGSGCTLASLGSLYALHILR